MSNALLELVHVRKAFGGVAAVDSVSTTIAPGEIRALIGPNGSGKTTLLNLVSGFYPLDEGTVVFAGHRIDGRLPHEIAALGIARTFQVPKIFRSMSVLDNLLVAGVADHRSDPLSHVRQTAAQVLTLIHLESLGDALAGTLSGGQSMLLQLGRGLMHSPLRLFLLDEPFAGVHPAQKEQIIALIRKLNAELGIAVLLVSHEIPTVRLLAHRCSVMHDGHWIAEGTLEEVAREPAVIEAYLGQRGTH